MYGARRSSSIAVAQAMVLAQRAKQMRRNSILLKGGIVREEEDEEGSERSNGSDTDQQDESQQEQLRAQKKPSRSERCIEISRLVLPHVGLVFLLAFYTVAGAGVFSLFELPYEMQTRDMRLRQLYETKFELVSGLWNLTGLNDTEAEIEFMQLAFDGLGKLDVRLWDAFKENIVTLNDIQNRTQLVWTFAQSIFFATTVITTIGYGHMAPSTVSGKVFCIVFGLFGIPLLLITIADIGKFMSDFISFLYRSYRLLKFNIKRRSRQLSLKRRSKRPNDEEELEKQQMTSSQSESESDEIRIPVVMVILFLVAYTAIGGVLFRYWEGWDYFEAFYFCFITMATIGFGDLVPTSQVYMFFTMIYIIIGLAITTMCIDLAGTEYIRKIHYFGTKIDTARDVAKGAVETGLHVGGGLVRIVRTAGGKFVEVGDNVFVNMRQAHALRKHYGLPEDYDFGGMIIPEGMTEEEYLLLHPEFAANRRALTNVLFQPLHPSVQKLVKPNMKVYPDEITEKDAFVLQNKLFDQAPRRKRVFQALIETQIDPLSTTQATSDQILIVPFILRESDV